MADGGKAATGPAAAELTGYACSPRSGGNSDQALTIVLEQLAAAQVSTARLALRDHCVLPCVGCQRCDLPPGGECFQKSKDQSNFLYTPLFTARAVCFAAPIYFYHLPAGFKAFIDRTQSYYVLKRRGVALMRDLPPRKAYVILVAGRAKGEKLFEGSLLTLQYFLEPFNITLAEPCLVRGMDKVGDLQQPDASEAVAALTAYGKLLAKALRP